MPRAKKRAADTLAAKGFVRVEIAPISDGVRVRAPTHPMASDSAPVLRCYVIDVMAFVCRTAVNSQTHHIGIGLANIVAAHHFHERRTRLAIRLPRNKSFYFHSLPRIFVEKLNYCLWILSHYLTLKDDLLYVHFTVNYYKVGAESLKYLTSVTKSKGGCGIERSKLEGVYH